MTQASPRPLPGGPLALDLLNTRWKDGDALVDWLDDDAAVEGFLAEHGATTAVSSSVDAARLVLVQARNLIEQLLDATVDGTCSDELAARINAALAAVRLTVRPTADGLDLVVDHEDPAEQLAGAALVNAAELTRESRSRVRSCEHDQCVLWFHDTSRGGRRRWCSMERCGNRAKAQRHYARSRT